MMLLTPVLFPATTAIMQYAAAAAAAASQGEGADAQDYK
jgi:hypothetical protein